MSAPTPKVVVAFASHDYVPVQFAYALAGLMSYSRLAIPREIPLGVIMQTGTYVPCARQELLAALLEDDVTHILWLDSDMNIPRDALIRLLQHKVPVVGCNYAKRGIPSDYVAIKTLSDPPAKLVTNEDSTGLEEVDAIGFGCLLMETSALSVLPSLEELPWFVVAHSGGHRWIGEDVWFCKLLRERGVKILVDHDLSKEVKHIGQFEYALEHAEIR